MMRTYIDETALGVGTATAELIRGAINDFCEVADAVRLHDDEVLLRANDIYEFDVRPDLKLMDFLFPTDVNDGLADARTRLQIAIDRATVWNDSDYEIATPDYDVTIGESTGLAPSLSQAIPAHILSSPVAVLALRTARQAGAITASSAEANGARLVAELLVVTSLIERPNFVRAWMLSHPPTPNSMRAYCDRAFPDLQWTETAHTGLRSHSKSFYGDRFETTMRHLAVLNDYAASIFWRVNEPARRQTELRHHAVDASAESSGTRANDAARKQRAGCWNNQDIYFWWHTKICWDSGRIHFHHDATSEAPGQIVLGFFVDHFRT